MVHAFKYNVQVSSLGTAEIEMYEEEIWHGELEKGWFLYKEWVPGLLLSEAGLWQRGKIISTWERQMGNR